MADESRLAADILAILDGIRAEDAPLANEPLAEEEVRRFDLSATEALEKEKLLAARLHSVDLAQDIKERKKYAFMIFCMVCVWLLLVMLMIVYSGWESLGVRISDAVLISLITGVSVNVIALFAIVAKYLFPKR